MLVPISVVGLIAALTILPVEPGVSANLPAWSSVLWVVIVASATILGETFSKGLWQQYLPLTLLLVVLSIVGFVVSERKGQPLFDYTLFKNAVYRMGALTNFMIFIVIYPLILFLPFYLQDYRGLSLGQSGLYLAISPVLSILVGPGSGHLADRIGYRVLVLGGLALNASGYALMAYGVQRDSLPLIAISLGVIGVGGALFSGPVFAAMMGKCHPAAAPDGQQLRIPDAQHGLPYRHVAERDRVWPAALGLRRAQPDARRAQ